MCAKRLVLQGGDELTGVATQMRAAPLALAVALPVVVEAGALGFVVPLADAVTEVALNRRERLATAPLGGNGSVALDDRHSALLLACLPLTEGDANV